MLLADDRPSAIFAASDTQAFGVIAAARELGLRVPEDLSIVGYDDIEAADYVGLTTVRQQLFESGRRGAEILLAEIAQRSVEPPVAELQPDLVVRATTAPPKEGRG
jgi:DNA-binding LacI/PurR family transcriptional regulator